MALVTLHRKLALANLVLVVVSVGAITWMATRRPAKAQVVSQQPAAASSSATINPLTAGRITHLRESLSLLDRDLAAMGCSQNQAAQILSTLLTWYRANQGNWEQHQQAQIAAHNSLQETWRQTNLGLLQVGTAESQITNQQQTAQATDAQLATLIDSAAQQIAPLLSSSQTAVWSTAQANASAPDQYRYAAGLTADQVNSIQWGMSKNLPPPTNTISAAQQASMDAAAASVQQAFGGVMRAEQSVLPVPPPTTQP